MDKTKNLSKEEKLMALRNTAWDLLKFSPKELKKQGINPINLVGANFSAKDMLNEMGVDVDEEVTKRYR